MGSKTKDEKKDKKAKKDKDKKAKKKRLTAATADKYVLYQRSVQEPEADIQFFEEAFDAHYGRKARDLREDFCGCAALACHWVRLRSQNRAWGVDLDPEPLAWGEDHNVSSLLDEEQRGRLTLIRGDVREPREPKVDLIAAQNFSFCIFKRREELRRYFEVCRAALNDQGLLVLDIYGGPDSQMVSEEETEYGNFSYVWDQKRYDAITNEAQCAIHFRFPDGTELEDAFTYDWRLWTISELRELLLEAGFAKAEAYWEGTDEDGEGNGEFTRTESEENEDAWIAYVVGAK